MADTENDEGASPRNFAAEMDAAETHKKWEFMQALKEACIEKWRPMLDKILEESATKGATGITSYHDILSVSLAHGGGEDDIPEYHQCYVRIRVPKGIRNQPEITENVVSMMNEGVVNIDHAAIPHTNSDGSKDVRICVQAGKLGLMGDEVRERFGCELPDLRATGISKA
ncbi:MAG: hypothetical protein J0M34_02880 [Alphaproteobacteria bacterium]|nr:hypothetical protein [Alphaproteobacteria bacterium]